MSEVQLLSTGSYHVLITASGHAYSRWKGMAVARRRADGTLDDGGARCHIREHTPDATGPRLVLPKRSHRDGSGHDFPKGRSTFWHRGQGIETRTALAVLPDDPVEVRRVVVTNLRNRRSMLSATSYAEIVLSPAATDAAHPAFSKLFVQTEIDPALRAIFATRRPSTPDDPTP